MGANDDIAGLARLAFGAWWRTAGWTLEVSRRTVQQALGIDDPPPSQPEPGAPESPEPRRADLRAQGAELLRRSAEVDEDEEFHPPYVTILEQLAPDEARILRLLYGAGPQPAVDVRSGALPIAGATELVAPGLTMIGAEAGLRRLDRVPAYLNNLYRLGLIWFSREALKDITRYQVLEAQPEGVDALARAGRGRTVRRSIPLTPFGADFAETVLPPQPRAPNSVA